MKFTPKSIITPLKGLKINSSWLWIFGIVFLSVILLMTISTGFMLGQQERVEQALLNGQRIEVELSSGKIFGKVQISESEKERIKAEEEAKKAAQLEKKEKKAVPLPWMNDDFIGPRMSDAMIAIIAGGEKKEEIKLQKISLKELGDKPIIIIIIKGLGLSSSTTEEALDLPANITLGFSPYSPSLEDWTKKAAEKGHEIILNVPMETEDYNINDPGPYALISKSSKEDNITRLKMLLSLIKDYKAIYSDKDEIFSHSIQSVTPILEFLKKEGKYFVYGGGYSDFSLIQVAKDLEYPLLINDIFLDDEISSDSINAKIKEIEEHAKERGYVVVTAHPYPITLRMLEIWLPQAEEKGFRIAPVSLLLGKTFEEE